MKRITKKEDLATFKRKYENLSGLNIPQEYLFKSKVYVFLDKDEIIGGFVLGDNLPLRTINVFVSYAQKTRLSQYFKNPQFCEVTCYWIDRKHRKNPWINAKIWLQMALKVSRQDKYYILYGTNSKGLAKMYGYPKKSVLIHQDVLEGKNTYVFVAKRADFFLGVFSIVRSKLLGQKRSNSLICSVQSKNQMLYDLSV